MHWSTRALPSGPTSVESSAVTGSDYPRGLLEPVIGRCFFSPSSASVSIQRFAHAVRSSTSASTGTPYIRPSGRSIVPTSCAAVGANFGCKWNHSARKSTVFGLPKRRLWTIGCCKSIENGGLLLNIPLYNSWRACATRVISRSPSAMHSYVWHRQQRLRTSVSPLLVDVGLKICLLGHDVAQSSRSFGATRPRPAFLFGLPLESCVFMIVPCDSCQAAFPSMATFTSSALNALACNPQGVRSTPQPPSAVSVGMSPIVMDFVCPNAVSNDSSIAQGPFTSPFPCILYCPGTRVVFETTL